MASVKLKSQAKSFVCQNKTQVAESITKIGDAQREITRLETEINDIAARALDERKEKIEALQTSIDELSQGVQLYCEANRDDLCKKGKTVNLITGEISWRQRPPKVSLRGIDKVIEALKTANLNKFIRTKEEINKDAILAEPSAVAKIKGISIKSGIEDFIIKPFELESSTP